MYKSQSWFQQSNLDPCPRWHLPHLVFDQNTLYSLAFINLITLLINRGPVLQNALAFFSGLEDLALKLQSPIFNHIEVVLRKTK